MVRDGPWDLSARHLAVLLICHLDEPPHTVHSLALRLRKAAGVLGLPEEA
jgi:hypothetical protein